MLTQEAFSCPSIIFIHSGQGYDGSGGKVKEMVRQENNCTLKRKKKFKPENFISQQEPIEVIYTVYINKYINVIPRI